jgi:hypothetical protein
VSTHVFATKMVKKQKDSFSKRDVQRAEVAQKLHNATGPMSLKDYIKAVSTGQITNCPVTPSDIKVVEIIFGLNKMCLRGKTTRQTTKQVRIEPIPLPLSISEKYREVTLAADIIFVGGYRFFVTVSEHIILGTSQYLEDVKITSIV